MAYTHRQPGLKNHPTTMVLRRGIVYGPSCAEPHDTLTRRVPNAQPSKVLRRSFWRSPGGAVRPQLEVQALSSGPTSNVTRHSVPRPSRQRPSRSLGILAAANRRDAEELAMHPAAMSSSQGAGIAQQFGVCGRSTTAAVRRSCRRTRHRSRDCTAITGGVKCPGGDGYAAPRYRATRNRFWCHTETWDDALNWDGIGNTSLR